MNLQKRYEQLASQLGDICYKLMLLEEHKNKLIAEIKKLDDIASMMAKKESASETKESEIKSVPNRTNSPS